MVPELPVILFTGQRLGTGHASGPGPGSLRLLCSNLVNWTNCWARFVRRPPRARLPESARGPGTALLRPPGRPRARGALRGRGRGGGPGNGPRGPGGFQSGRNRVCPVRPARPARSVRCRADGRRNHARRRYDPGPRGPQEGADPRAPHEERCEENPRMPDR
jgi:hypothetical protein